jgi:hypothetical protein
MLDYKYTKKIESVIIAHKLPKIWDPITIITLEKSGNVETIFFWEGKGFGYPDLLYLDKDIFEYHNCYYFYNYESSQIDRRRDEYTSVLQGYRIPMLSLDNLLPWLDEIFGQIENPDYKVAWLQQTAEINYSDDPSKIDHDTINWLGKLMQVTPKTIAARIKQQAITLYHSDPQKLTDLICEAIEEYLSTTK